MSALLRQRLFRAKIVEKSHVCWDIVFGRVLEEFHVLRTDRRTEGDEERRQVHVNQCLLQPLMQYVPASALA